MHLALAPIALGLDPGARAQVVTVVEVFEAAELATALEQAEALGILDREGAHREVLGIVQRTPDPFAVAGMDRQAVGIVQFRAVVELRRRLVGAEQVHAGQRRQADAADGIAQIDPRLHVDHRVVARTQDEAVGAGGTRRIQQRVDHQMLVAGFRTLDPEFAEARKLFSGRQRGVDRQAARGEAVGLALADHAEVAGAEQGHHLVLLVRLVDRIEHAEAGVADVLQRLRAVIEFQRAEIEVVRVVLDFMDAGGGDFVELHRGVELHALVVEAQLEGGVAIGPEQLVGAVLDLLVVGELEVAQGLGQVVLRCFVGLVGQTLRFGTHVVEAERLDLGGATSGKQCKTQQHRAKLFGPGSCCNGMRDQRNPLTRQIASISRKLDGDDP